MPECSGTDKQKVREFLSGENGITDTVLPISEQSLLIYPPSISVAICNQFKNPELPLRAVTIAFEKHILPGFFVSLLVI